jgi:hypothetical protein
LARWIENFTTRHGDAALTVADGALHGVADDGSTFAARLPLGTSYAGPAATEPFLAALALPREWGILLVRKGGFAVARLESDRIIESKVGQRHVQGRTKAGGQSQQRFARRRDNQARAAYEAAADHAARVLGLDTVGRRELPVVLGGDHAALDDVLTDPRLAGIRATGPWLAVADPRRSVLEAAIQDAMAIGIDVVNASA